MINRSRFPVVFVLILLLYGCGGGPRVADQQPPKPPRVKEDSELPYRKAIGDQPTIRILLGSHFQFQDVLNSSLAQTVRFRVMGDTLEMSLRNGDQWVVSDNRTGFRLYPDEGKLLGMYGHHYRGVIDLFINPLGTPVAVNEVGLEDYLKSVVPREMGPTAYPRIEALKAQAVAARTFAVRELDRNAVKGFDLYGDSRAQNYQGAMVEHRLSNRAVDETAGIIAINEGKPILAMYSSTCGGMTEAYHHIFKGAAIPYLQGGVVCDDAASPYHRWSTTIRVADIQKSIDSYAGIGNLKSLEILNKSPNGRVISMRFSGSGGEKILEGNDLRFALELRSNYIDTLESFHDPEGFISRIEVSGRGWGHGVGMCQIGAVTMAGQGKKYDEILHHYYQGIELVEWNGRPSRK